MIKRFLGGILFLIISLPLGLAFVVVVIIGMPIYWVLTGECLLEKETILNDFAAWTASLIGIKD